MDKNKKLKKILRDLRIARASDYVTYNAVMSSSIMDKAIKTLEETSEWNEEDEKGLEPFLQKVRDATKQKMTLKEKCELIKNILEEK